MEEFPLSFAKADEVGPYLLIEYSAQQLCCQLTLLQQVQRTMFTWKIKKYLSSYFISVSFLQHFPTQFQAYFHKALNQNDLII